MNVGSLYIYPLSRRLWQSKQDAINNEWAKVQGHLGGNELFVLLEVVQTGEKSVVVKLLTKNSEIFWTYIFPNLIRKATEKEYET